MATPSRVLIVEDNPLNFKLVRDVLLHAGFDVVEARSGEEGIVRALEDRPDMILMDLQLPGIDGTQAMRTIKRTPTGSSIPIVALTAFAMSEDRERALRDGFDGYLSKPISVRDLPRQIASSCPSGPPMTERVTILAVDDQPANLRLLEAVLSPQGYRVITASSGEQALELLHSSNIDLVLLDIMMPGIDGYEVCRRIRSEPSTAFLPVVMITASGDYEKTRAIKAGADDFISKPFHQGELLARVASLARIKRYHDTITRQAAELAQWNAELEARVQTQLEELQRVNRLRRFLSPQVAELVINSGDDSVLRQSPSRDRRGLLRSARVHGVR